MEKTGQNRVGSQLLIGYGNPLRGDDGAGCEVVGFLEREDLPGVTCIVSHQLTPDLAIRLSEAAYAYFIDAIPAGPDDSDLRVARIGPLATDAGVSSHACSPESLLQLSASLYGSCPESTLIGIPASDFTLGQHISPATKVAALKAASYIRERLGVHA